MRYVPYGELDGRPNVIVDGAAAAGTVLTLSHWPQSGTPPALAADLSAESAFAYLDRPDLHVAAELVSNNHLDEDGVVGVYALVAPDHALSHRDLLVEVARAGDFQTTGSRVAARVAFAVSALGAEPGAGYESVLDRLPALLDDPDGARALWGEEDEELARSLDAVAAGDVEVEEVDDLDLSVVTVSSSVPGSDLRSGSGSGGATPAVSLGSLHPIALHNAIRGFTVLLLAPGSPHLSCRYESWVQYRSRRPRPRRDLRPLAERLSAEDAVPWRAGSPGDLVPACVPRGESSLDPELLRSLVEDHLRHAEPAWDPYD